MAGLPLHIALDIQAHLDAIAGHFKAPKITLLVRPEVAPHLDADCVVTNDELPLAIQALERRHALDPKKPGGPEWAGPPNPRRSAASPTPRLLQAGRQDDE